MTLNRGGGEMLPLNSDWAVDPDRERLSGRTSAL